ncbi:glycerophosphoryl diester phosphodiesterase [Albibacterium bauzanense]|uniref:Glycerophosphoryl diester phosphodiesterase n=2 Tax=Albibacterium bauzanense TaxID=653929 RepID=A0A4R1LVP1_9SPHI|nr:glycerophosphoryl diester phosphodiesterase [Albibacterium bauzanense]
MTGFLNLDIKTLIFANLQKRIKEKNIDNLKASIHIIIYLSSMKRILSSFLSLAILLCMNGYAKAQDISLKAIRLDNTKALHDFFRFKEGNAVIISGHRGGMVEGFPENSIATFENTLRNTPAFYEIDPRLTKDSVIVLMHDATLDRTTTGTGKVSDYTWEELKKFRLKDPQGNITEFGIPTLAEVIEWARGKTILNLDKKDVPFEMTAAIIKEHKAEAFMMLTVHSPEEARFYLDKNPNSMFSAHILTPEMFDRYDKAGIPWTQIMAYIGPNVKSENQKMYTLLHSKGVKCMISAASTYDKLTTKEERAEAYRKISSDGADVIETDLPIEVSEALGN